MQISLSKLVASRNNPRRVKPEREAHRKLVASIRAHGLVEPLVVRPENGSYRVIAGNRRLAALRAVFGRDDIEVTCEVRKVDAEEAEALSLTENFNREPMHPLDEAEAFAKLADVDRKGVHTIAIEFGVSESYVRQRMKLAGLCGVVKAAYRAGEIDTATAEAFTAVPVARQEELWEQVGGKPRHADQIRNLTESDWIDARHALFDVESLPAEAISMDLFRESVLIRRSEFLEAQIAALNAERVQLVESGWSEVVVGASHEVQDRLRPMVEPQPELTPDEQARLDALDAGRDQLDPTEDDEAVSEAFEVIDAEADAILRGARGRYGEATKSRGTVFLILSPEGTVERLYRVPRPETKRNGQAPAGVTPEVIPPLTARDLSDKQRAALFAHEAIAVRQAVAGSAIVRKRLLVLALHEGVRSDAIAIRVEANSTTLHAQNAERFQSETLDTLRTRQDAIDPLKDERFIEEDEGYRRLCGLSETQLDAIIDTLIVASITGHGNRETPLVQTLAQELDVSIRKHWTPDAAWLAGYQKIQLADLIGTLRGPAHGSAALGRKKSELVSELAALFSQARNAAGGFEDPGLVERVNSWEPKIAAD